MRMRTLLPAALLLVTNLAVADVGPGLYVSEAGEDSGDCTDINAPCRNIGYALSVAAKNTRIHVAVGRYPFSDPEQILYAMSGAVHVHGGYVENDAGEWIKGGTATLTSVPPGYREFFKMHGFRVVADAKGDETWPESAPRMLEQHKALQQRSASLDCVAGSAGGFECSNINLVSHTPRVDFSSSPMAVADIWGFVDLNTRREYVIVGVQNGTAVFDVSNPEAPREIGFVGGQSATWRDVKILQRFNGNADRWEAFAYVTTDGAADGLFVIDLTGLPHAIEQVPYASDFSNAHNIYLTDTDYGTGLAATGVDPVLVVAGSGRDRGQFRLYGLDDPAAPSFISRSLSAGYMHDASSLRIDDARAADCADGGPSCNVLLDFNEENVDVWDITDVTSPTLLASVPSYPNRGYVHSGWWSEDRRYAFVHDELDERNSSGLPTTLRVLSLDDLAAPAYVGTWTGSNISVDHNGFVRGNRYYMANYTRGLTVLDISNPVSPQEVGYFDTYPSGNNSLFAGAWGAYPYLPSGVIAVSDINSGLYLFDDATREGSGGQLRFTARTIGVEEGQSLAVPVERTGGSSGSASVGIEIVQLTAEPGDYQLATARLDWADGDAGTRQVDLAALAGTSAEPLEELMIRLVDPQGAASLGVPNVSSVFIADAGATGTLSLASDAIQVAEEGAGLAIVTVKRGGNAVGATSVDFSVTPVEATPGDDFAGASSGTLSWADGDGLPKSIEFEIAADGASETEESFDVTFANPQSASFVGPATARVTILDGSGVNSAPSASAGANQRRTAGSNVMLNGSASFDPDGDALTYSWTQESGPGVTLGSAKTETATFVAPAVTADTDLLFRLTVTDDRGESDSATTTVTVSPQADPTAVAPRSGGSGTLAPFTLLLLGGLAFLRVAALQRRGRLSRTDCDER